MVILTISLRIWKERKCGQVWCPILWKCALPFTHPSAHARTHTHPRSSGHRFLLHPQGSSWGFGALLKGTSVVVLRVFVLLYLSFVSLKRTQEASSPVKNYFPTEKMHVNSIRKATNLYSNPSVLFSDPDLKAQLGKWEHPRSAWMQ